MIAYTAVVEMSSLPLMVFLFFPYAFLLKCTEQYHARLPSNITGLSDSCLRIPCEFEADSTQMNNGKIFVFWVKTTHSIQVPANVVYNGTTNMTKGFSHIEITGNLGKNDCTTVFYNVMKNHSDNYYFRVEIEPQQWYFSYTNPVYISVSDIPQAPMLKPSNLQEVMEESTVNLSCSAEAPCPSQPPNITWSYIPEYANITTQLLEKPNLMQSVISLMTFKASYKDNRKNISCIVSYLRNTSNDSTVETNMLLNVLFPPKETNIIISPSASVPIGTNVTLTCKSTANPSDKMNYTWYKCGEEKQLIFGESLFFNADTKNAGLYFCKAENELGNQTSEGIQLVVENAAALESLYLIIGCVGGVSVFLFLFLLVTLFLRMRRVKSFVERETDTDQLHEKPVQISTVYANAAFLESEEPEMPNAKNDIVHYGEIDFSSPQIKSTTAQSSGQETTIYAEVCNRISEHMNMNDLIQ
ncbi:B-cell receptor CD22-like isoform X2 [Danio rerio]|uniref:B-cell receptor CD22-like isoform X2 n=1 Tax=Danio rerio TaxID=7955 RepID=A0AB32TIE9_DANRE